MPFSMAEVVNDPDFAQGFTIMRNPITWVLGKVVSTPVSVPGYGIIAPASEEDLEQVPEGDRVTGSIVIHTSVPMYETTTDKVSDRVTWNGQQYRVLKVWPWQDFGYTKVLLCRVSGE